MTKVYCLNGVHTSGKSVVGKELQKRGYYVLEESAKTLIDQGNNPFGKGKLSGDRFQRTVMEMEFERESEIAENTVIETYHPGNIAHCMLVANRDTLTEYERRFSDILERRELLAVYLQIPFEEIEKRSKLFPKVTLEIVEFYKKLEGQLFSIYSRFGIPYTIVNNCRGLGDTVEEVEGLII